MTDPHETKAPRMFSPERFHLCRVMSAGSRRKRAAAELQHPEELIV